MNATKSKSPKAPSTRKSGAPSTMKSGATASLKSGAPGTRKSGTTAKPAAAKTVHPSARTKAARPATKSTRAPKSSATRTKGSATTAKTASPRTKSAKGTTPTRRSGRKHVRGKALVKEAPRPSVYLPETPPMRVAPVREAIDSPIQIAAAQAAARARAAAVPGGAGPVTPSFPRDEYDYGYLLDFLATPAVPGNCRAVVFGCGKGEASVFLCSKGYRVTGLDADRNAVGLARERAWLSNCDVDFMIGDVFETTGLLPAESFGIAIDQGSLQEAARAGREAPGVFQTIKGERERRRYLESVHRLLLPGGIFLLAATQVDMPKTTAGRQSGRDGALLVQEGGETVGEIVRAGLRIFDRVLYPVGDGTRAELVLYCRK